MAHTRAMSAFIAGLRYDDLPPRVVEVVKRIALDTIGTTLAATTLGDGCAEAESVVRGAGGSAECSLIGYGAKAPALTAAFVNGSTAHALNFDPLGGSGGHLGVSTLPSALAAAERRGGVSGIELITAMAAAAEVTARLAVALSRAGVNANERFLEGQLLGYFGAAVGAGRVMELSAREMHSALGAALMQAGGSMQVVFDGDPPAKAIYGGFANLGGMLAALLAEQGLGAEVAALEGQAGLYGLFYGGVYDASALSEGLGEEWRLLDARFKPWPTSGNVHPYIEAATQIAAQGVGPDDVRAIIARAGTALRPWCEPIEERRRPPNPTSAANSIVYGIAKALTNGQVVLGDFTPTGLLQEEALRVADLADCEIDDAYDGRGTVEVHTVDGRVLTESVEVSLGHPSRPLSDEQLIDKFRDCAGHAANPIPDTQLQTLIDALWSLETLSDIGQIGDLSRGPVG